MTEPRRDVVCDAGPLIHLDELGCLELLADFPVVWVPEAVRDEVKVHRPSALARSTPVLRVEPVPPPSEPAVRTLIRSLALDRGEQAALTLAAGLSHPIFLTDDSAARLAAKTLGLRAHGTLGILLRSIRRGQRSRRQVVDDLRSLPRRSTLFVRRGLLEEIIRDVEHPESG